MVNTGHGASTTPSIRLLAGTLAVGVAAGAAISVLAFALARYGPAGDSWSFRGNGALAAYTVIPALLAAGWTALVLRYRTRSDWLAIGAGAGLVGLLLAGFDASIADLWCWCRHGARWSASRGLGRVGCRISCAGSDHCSFGASSTTVWRHHNCRCRPVVSRNGCRSTAARDYLARRVISQGGAFWSLTPTSSNSRPPYIDPRALEKA